MTLTNPFTQQEAIRQALVRLRREGGNNLGVPLILLANFMRENFGIEIEAHVNTMLRDGSLIAARAKAKDCPELKMAPGMQRPELMESVSLAEANERYPRLYLSNSSDLPVTLLPLVNRREKLARAAREIAAGTEIPLVGGDNVVPIERAKVKR